MNPAPCSPSPFAFVALTTSSAVATTRPGRHERHRLESVTPSGIPERMADRLSSAGGEADWRGTPS